jgi:hypothetical protein
VSAFRIQLSTITLCIITASVGLSYSLAASPAIKARMETRRKVRTWGRELVSGSSTKAADSL